MGGAVNAEPPESPDPQPAPSPESRTTSPESRAASPGRQAQPARPGISQIQQTVRASARDRAARNRADESWNLRVPVKAGARSVVVTFLNSVSALEETPRLPFERPFPAGVNIPETRRGAYLRSVEISGPHDATGPGEGQSRKRIFTCSPPSGTQRTSSPRAGADADACAKTILGTLARRAYRRNAKSTDIEPLVGFYRDGRSQGGFDAGIEHALRRLLVSPEFLLRVERDPAGSVPGAVYSINDVQIASRVAL